MSWAAIIIITLGTISAVHSNLRLEGTKCGVLQCQIHEYCSQFDRQCKPCANICDAKSHNYEEGLCEKDCQDYLHDIRYVRTGNDAGNGIDLRADIEKLTTLVTVALVLVCLVIVALLGILFYKIYKWSQKNEITASNIWDHFKKPSTDADVKTNNGVIDGRKVDLRLDIPSPGVQSENSPETMTTSISRRPAEDSALDYAYDNHAMTTTPSPHNNKANRESNF